MKELPSTYDVGNVRYIHRGFRVHKIVGKFKNPMEPVGKVYDNPETALKALDGLGDGYAMFRIVHSTSGDEPRELIARTDLPVRVVAKIT